MKPTFIDTHCHLDMSQFEKDREDVIRRARDAGVENLITIGSDIASSRAALEIAGAHDGIYAAAGVHPHEAKGFTPETLEALRTLAEAEKVVAIGETGLDYHYMHSPKEVQQEVFRKHLALAVEFGLPAIVHSREAGPDTLDIIRQSGCSKGVLHCFSGDMDMAEAAMSMGFHISFAGPVTFRKAEVSRLVASRVPDDYLLIETDAPYLTPEPVRGRAKRNEPAFIVHTAEAIAALRGITVEDAARITSINAWKLFGIGQMPGRGAITYRIRDNLYLNITNRCTNNCSFCIRAYSDFVKGHMLRLKDEPAAEELKKEIGRPEDYKEIVLCGYGEPLIRLNTVKEVASWVKERGGLVRVNTNGQGSLIHKRNIVPELGGLVDAVSVSLDAQDEPTYNRLCKPAYPGAFAAMLDFVREAGKYIPRVQVTVVDAPGVDVEACRRLAGELGAELRVRKLDVVG